MDRVQAIPVKQPAQTLGKKGRGLLQPRRPLLGLPHPELEPGAGPAASSPPSKPRAAPHAVDQVVGAVHPGQGSRQRLAVQRVALDDLDPLRPGP